MFYQLAISLLMILYEFYACTWGHHDEPGFLYEPNDLTQHTTEVYTRRREFIQNRSKRPQPI